MVRVKVVGLVVAPISKFSGLINAYTLTPDPALTLNSSVAYVFSLPETGLKFLITMFVMFNQALEKTSSLINSSSYITGHLKGLGKIKFTENSYYILFIEYS